MKSFSTILFCLFILIACNSTKDFQTLFDEAQRLTQDSSYIDAIEILDEVIEINPEFDSAYVERAFCYYQLQNFEAAEIDIKKAIDLQSGNYEARYVSGLIYMAIGNFQQAYNDFGMSKHSGDTLLWPSATLHRAACAFRLYDDKEAFTEVEEVLSKYPNDYDALCLRGIFELEQNIYTVLKDSIEQNITDSTYFKTRKYYRVSNIIDAQGFPVTSETVVYNTKEALDNFLLAIQSDPSRPEAYHECALVYRDLKMNILALEYAEKAILRDASASDYYVTCGLICRDLNRPNHAIDYFTQAIELDPENANAYINRGYSYQEDLNNPEAAAEDFEMAEKLGVTKD